MKLIHLFLVSILISSSAYAAKENVPRSGRTVTVVSSYDNAVIVKFAPSYTNSQNCSSASDDTIILEQASDPNNAMMSTILSAATAGKETGFGIEGCFGAYAKIYRVDVAF